MGDIRTRARFQLDAALTAVQFLTRVPVPGGMSRPGPDPRLLPAAVVYFPLVGTLVGLTTGGVIWTALHVWPTPVAVLLGLAAEALLTGGFHEDAVADSCDAFGGGWTQEDVLRIMADSRVGSFGALGLFLLVALRGTGLAAVPAGEVALAAGLAGGVGRLGIVGLMAAVPPVPKRDGLAKDVGTRMTPAAVGWAGLLALPVVLAAAANDPGRTGCALLAVAGVVAAWGWYVRRRLGGVTGDCLGCAAYLGQVAVVSAWAAGRS